MGLFTLIFNRATARLRLSVLAMAMGGVLLAGCAGIEQKFGYIPPEEDVAAIVVGRDTVASVEQALGRPGTSGVLTNSAWYYVRSDTRTVGFRAREELDRQVLAISFDGRGVVQNIERFGLEDGNVVVLTRRVTDSGIAGTSILRQIFGNVGGPNAATFFN